LQKKKNGGRTTFFESRGAKKRKKGSKKQPLLSQERTSGNARRSRLYTKTKKGRKERGTGISRYIISCNREKKKVKYGGKRK